MDGFQIQTEIESRSPQPKQEETLADVPNLLV
jgi:hypothetical protein